MRNRPRATSTAWTTLADRIVDAALAEAEAVGWENVRLRTVAAKVGITLDQLGRHYRDLDEVADAWFQRGWDEMLATPPEALAERSERERLEILLLRWLDALASHRQITGQMLATKMWPFHPHHWVPMIFNLSRTIQWLRDAAALDAGGPRRAVEEVGLTWLFLGTLLVWVGDETPNQERTREFLRNRLQDAEMVMRLWPMPAQPPRS